MCHQSVGLVQGQIEAAGIPTLSTTVVPFVTRHLRVPRAAYVRFPIGNPFGPAHDPDRQRLVLTSLFDAFEAIAEPGTIVELPFRWGQIEAHVLEDGEGDASEAFLIAREAAKHIAEAYEALRGGCRQYEENLRALLTRLERDPSSDPTMVRGVRQFLSWLESLSDMVDKPLQEQVMWNTTRYFLLQYMHEGRFR